MRKPKKLPVIVTAEEYVKLIKATRKTLHKVAFALGFGSGLRISEVTHLEKRDIDFKEKIIHVREGKGSRDRTVPLPKGFHESYLKYIPIPQGVRALQKAFKRTADKAGLLETKPTLHFHSLRHGFGSRLAGEGVPIHHIRTMMGHSNIATTNVYLEANPKEALKWYDEKF